jgi:aspartate aminotransferase
MLVQLSRTREHAREEYEKFLGVFLRESPVVASRGRPGVADLLFGDPHDPAIPEIANILREQVDKSQQLSYRYIHHLQEAREAAAKHLSRRSEINFNTDDVFLNTGAFAGLTCCLQAICDPGSEVIYLSPPWFYYRSMIKAAGAQPRGIDLYPEDWSIPLDKIADAIGPKTCALLINSPHNPTGKVFSEQELLALAKVVSEGSRRIGRPIPVISDEAYARIVFDRPHAPSIAKYYPTTIVIYTFGKTLLAPSLRLGYMALSPGFPDADRMHRSFDAIQPIGGWLLPTCIMQRALPEFENLCIDLERLIKRREKLISALCQGRFRVIPPKGTFYMLVDSPIPNDEQFAQHLADKGILVLPGSTLETPGTFRISLTASDAMIEKACIIFSEGYRL